MTPTIAAIIIGIDGWERFTLPLIESIYKHEPSCDMIVVDNASTQRYPHAKPVVVKDLHYDKSLDYVLTRTERLCYSAAINWGYVNLLGNYDWYIVLSNDVLCIGPFAHVLEAHGSNNLVGPLLKFTDGFPYLEGWAIATPRKAWQAIGQWDEENFHGSSWEDVWWSTEARLHGYTLVEDLPFIHLDQRQRYHIIPDFGGMDSHNRTYFLGKYGQWANK